MGHALKTQRGLSFEIEKLRTAYEHLIADALNAVLRKEFGSSYSARSLLEKAQNSPCQVLGKLKSQTISSLLDVWFENIFRRSSVLEVAAASGAFKKLRRLA